MSSFGQRLELAMEVGGYRATDVCKETGFSQANMSHFISGQREPTVKSLARLLQALPDVDARWLICGGRK